MNESERERKVNPNIPYPTILSYIQLSNAGMSKMPDRKHLIQQMKLCLNNGAYMYKRYDHLYDHLMRKISDKFHVSGDDYKTEQMRLICTTYRNINIWFITLRHFFN